MIKARLFALFLGLGLLTGLVGCLTPPDYPDEPSIEFKAFDVIRNARPRPFTPVDTLKITVSFKDGNGDLGLTADEIQNSPPPFTGDNRYNYLLRVFRRTPPAAQFTEIPGLEFGQFFPLITGGVNAKPAPLKGDLTFRKAYDLGSPFRPGDEVRCTVSIKDRALNESNTITTSVKNIK